MNSPIDLSIAVYGSDRMTTVGTATGRWFNIQAMVDSVVTVVGNIRGNSNNIPLIAGTCIYGDFTSVQLVSGDIVCYRRI